ncbi:MAG: MBL fold metallo-hydrolase [Oscillospiraceae bacterium]|nr:MBL fold metallo-hydrolase [Oscillospiraceae bacterium]
MKRRLLTVLLSCALLTSCAGAEESSLTLIALNVGKGDCLLLGSGETLYLIDAGLRENWGMVSNALHQMGVKRLDGVIITHTDDDHAGGAWPLAMSGMEIGGWYAPKFYTDVKESKHPVMLAAALRGESVTWLEAGDSLPLDGAKLTVLGPRSQNKDAENCNSLVLLAEGGGGKMLLTGDMEFPEEEELLGAGVIPACDVLKVGNHGEEDATSEALVRQVKPRVAIISTNTVAEPDTPSDRVMKLLSQQGAAIYQTQHAPVGVMVTLAGGETKVSNLSSGELPNRCQTVQLADKSAKKDSISLVNHGTEAVDISGWYILSDRGGEMFVFADRTLQPGEKITITGQSSDEKGDVTWPEKKVWHKSKSDKASLYDVYGRLIDEMD